MPSTTDQRRGPWSRSEDDRLKQLVDLRGPTNWVAIANELGTRSAKQCRERYHQNLKQSLDHTPIRPDEGVLINTMVNQIGKRWAEIARHLHNRCDNTVKNWWNGGQNRRIRKDRRRASRQFGRQDETYEGQSPDHHDNFIYPFLGSQGERSYLSTITLPRPPSITSPRLYALSHGRASSFSRSLPNAHAQRRMFPDPGLPSPSTTSQSSAVVEYYDRASSHSRMSPASFHYGSNQIRPLTPGSQSSGSSSPLMLPLPHSILLSDDSLKLPPIGLQHDLQRDGRHSQSNIASSPWQTHSTVSTLKSIAPIYTGHEPEISPTTVTYRSKHPPTGSYYRHDGSIYRNVSPTCESRPAISPILTSNEYGHARNQDSYR